MTTTPSLDVISRFLQQRTTDVFETYDSSNAARVDDFGYETDEAVPAFVLIFIVSFFLLWNCMIGRLVTPPLLYMLRGKCHRNFMFLICPHWLIGIVLPGILGFSFFGPFAIISFTVVTVIIPYGCIITHNFKEDEELRQLYSFGVCCIHNTDDDNDNDDAESPRRRYSWEEQLDTPTATVTTTNKRVKESSSTTDLLIIKKVREASRNPKIKTNATAPSKEKEENQSFRFNHPKSDVFIRKSEPKKKQKASSLSSGSVLVCAICLEEYCVGDDIAYSRNINCHHFFHKNCVEQLLQENHTECPICRNSYIDVWEDIELGGGRR